MEGAGKSSQVGLRGRRLRRASYIGIGLVAVAVAAVGWTLFFPGGEKDPKDGIAFYSGDVKVAFESRPFLLAVKGTVQVRPKGTSEFVPLLMDTLLGSGDTVRTGPDGQVDILVDERTTFRLAPNSELHLVKIERDAKDAAKKTVRLDLARGEVTSQIAKTPAGEVLPRSSAYEVGTPIVVAGVRGTLFSVKTTQEASTIGVLTGTVRARSRQDEEAGKSWEESETWEIPAGSYLDVRADPEWGGSEGSGPGSPPVVVEPIAALPAEEKRALDTYRSETSFVETVAETAAAQEADLELPPGEEREIEKLVRKALESFEKMDMRGLAELVVSPKKHDLEFRFNQLRLAEVSTELERRFALAAWVDISIRKRGKSRRIEIVFDSDLREFATVRVWVDARAFHRVLVKEISDEGFIVLRLAKKGGRWFVWTGQTYLQNWK